MNYYGELSGYISHDAFIRPGTHSRIKKGQSLIKKRRGYLRSDIDAYLQGLIKSRLPFPHGSL